MGRSPFSALGRVFAAFDAAEGAGAALPFLGDAYIAPNADAFAVHFAENAAAKGTTALAVVEAAIEGPDLAGGLVEGWFGHSGAALLAPNARNEAGPAIA